MTSQVIARSEPLSHTSFMTGDSKLRLALRTNAVSSASFGIFGLAFAGWVVEVLGNGTEVVVRVIAAGLVLFAAYVWFVSTRAGDDLSRQTLLVSIGDLGWVAASIGVIAAGLFTTVGAIIAGLVAVLVFDFAAAQLYARSQLAAL